MKPGNLAVGRDRYRFQQNIEAHPVALFRLRKEVSRLILKWEMKSPIPRHPCIPAPLPGIHPNSCMVLVDGVFHQNISQPKLCGTPQIRRPSSFSKGETEHIEA